MINSKADYKYYLEADRLALRQTRSSPKFIGDEVWKFQRLLRKAEYLHNCKKDIFSRFFFKVVNFQLKKLSFKLGFQIPINVFGPGLSIAHPGTIVVNNDVRVGSNCRVHVCVNIGTSGGSKQAPVIGDNVYIGPGAKIFGPIRIEDGIVIGANAVVNKSFLEKNITIAGIPAKKISNKDSGCHLVKATELIGPIR